MKKESLLTSLAAGSMILTGLAPTTSIHAQEIQNPDASTADSHQSAQDILEQKILEAKQILNEKESIMQAAQEAYDSAVNAEKPYQSAYDTARTTFTQQTQTVESDVAMELLNQIHTLESVQQELETAQSTKAEKESALQSKQESLTQAQSDYEAAKEAYDDALANADSVSPEEIEAAKAKLDVAEDNLNAVQIEKMEAENDLFNATNAVEKAEAALADAQNTIQSYQDAYTQAQQATQEAQKAYEEALNNYNTLNDPNAKELLEQQLQEAQTTLEQKKVEEATAAQAVATAQEQLDTATESFQTAQTELANTTQVVVRAEAKLNAAFQEAYAAQQAYEQAQSEHQTEYDAWQEAVKAAETKKAELETAQQTVRQLESEIQSTQQEIESVEAQIKDLEDQSGVINDEVVNSMRGFLQSLGLEDLMNSLVSEDENGMSLETLKSSLNYIQQCNDIRKAEGLNELQVSTTMMLYSLNQNQWTIDNYHNNPDHQIEHSGLYNVGENLAINGKDGDVFYSWYTNEKETYEQACAENPEIAELTANELSKKYPDLYHKVGHYLNIIDPKYQTTGFSILESIWYMDGNYGGDWGRNSYWYGQTFSNKKFGDEMTVSEYMAKLDAYIASLEGSDSSTDELREKLETLKAELATLQSQKATAEGQVTTAQDAYTQAQKDATAKEEAYQELEASLEPLRQEMETTREAASQARIDYLNLYHEMEAQRETVTNLQTQKENAASALTEAQTAHDTAVQGREEAESSIETIEYNLAHFEEAVAEAGTKVENAQQTLNDAKTAEAQAKAAYEEKAESLQPYQTAVEEAKANQAEMQTRVDALKEKEAEAQAAYDAAKEAYEALLNGDSTTNVEQALEALKAAEKKVNALTDEVKALESEVAESTTAVETAQSDVETAQSRKALLESLQAEVSKVAAGQIITPMETEDAFVQSVQALYPSITGAFATMQQAEMALNEAQEVTATATGDLREAQDAYNQAKATYEALIDEMNDLINDQIKPEDPTTPESPSTTPSTDSSPTTTTETTTSTTTEGTDTGVFTGSSASLLAMGVSALTILRMSRKSKKDHQ